MSRLVVRTLVVLFCMSLVVVTGCELVIDVGDDDGAGDGSSDVVDDSPPPVNPPPPGDDSPFEPVACTSDCCDACTMLASCTDLQADFDNCAETCEQSIPIRGTPCLAMRIFWINEEGCGSIVEAYQRFDLEDDCSGSQF